MPERWDEISFLSSLRIFAGVLFDLFGFKLEMMLKISFLLVDQKNELEELFSMYSEKFLCE